MTLHETNGLTILTQSKTNIGARWSRTPAFELGLFRDIKLLILKVLKLSAFCRHTTDMAHKINKNNTPNIGKTYYIVY
jgi:hypothetical protein